MLCKLDVPKVIIILKIKSTQIKLGGLHSGDTVNTLLTRRIMPQVIGFNKDMSRSRHLLNGKAEATQKGHQVKLTSANN
jgi:hypothetical protein